MIKLKLCLILFALLLIITIHAKEQVTLQLKWTHAFQFAGYYAAVEQGYYSEAGLEVLIKEANPELDVVQEVLKGNAQYGVASSGLLLERAAGKPVVVLAVIFQHSPYRIFTSSDITSIDKIVGKSIMLESHSEELLAYLKKADINLNDVDQKVHSFEASSLITGETSAMSGYVCSEPYYFHESEYPFREYNPRAVGIDFYGDNLFTSDEELAKNPERAKSFRAASMKGWQYAKENPEEIIDLIFSKYSQLHSKDYLRFEANQMIPLLQPDLVEIGYMSPIRWGHIADTYADIGLLPKNYDLDNFIFKMKEPNYTRFYVSLTVVIALLFLIVIVTIYILRVNRRLANSLSKLKKVNEALIESEKSYAGLFNSSSELIYIQDSDGKFIDVNDSVCKNYGYSRDELLGETPEFVSAEEKNDLDQIIRDFYYVFKTGKTQKFEFWGKRKNGEIFPKEVICYKGRYFGKDVVIATARDVSERKLAEETILAGRERLKILNKIIRHDLSNDFSVIQSAINLFRRDPDDSILSAISDRVKNSIKTIVEYKNYEDFIESNVGLKEVNLNDVLDKLVGSYPEIDISIKGKGRVFADDALESVFLNLISNSIKHGQSTAIDFILTPDKEMFRIEVADNGIIIPDNIKQEIFEEGFHHGENGNTGIGLHIVKKTIENYGGSVFVRDNPNGGTTVVMILRRVLIDK